MRCRQASLALPKLSYFYRVDTVIRPLKTYAALVGVYGSSIICFNVSSWLEDEEGLLMLNFQIQRPTSWREIANRIQKEKDPEKVVRLSKELLAAIDLQTGNPGKKQPQSVRLNGKPRF